MSDKLKKKKLLQVGEEIKFACVDGPEFDGHLVNFDEANKRTLKKEINYVAGELLSECLCNKYLIPGTDAEKVDALMGKIIGIQDDFLCRVGANGDKDPKKVKVYYRKLRADFDEAIDGIFEDLAALNA